MNEYDLTEFMLRMFAGLLVLLLAGIFSLFSCFVCTVPYPVQKSEPACRCCCDPSEVEAIAANAAKAERRKPSASSARNRRSRDGDQKLRRACALEEASQDRGGP